MSTSKTVRFRLIVSLIITIFVSSILLAGCGGFDIKGTWKVSDGSFGQAQTGAVIVFDGKNCNLYSPIDTYSFTKSGSDYELNVTGLLGGSFTFAVKKIGSDSIELYKNNEFYVAMQRG